MADDEYDVFAGLNDNSEDERKQFLLTLAKDNVDFDSDDNLDDFYLPTTSSKLNGKTKKISAKKPMDKPELPTKVAKKSGKNVADAEPLATLNGGKEPVTQRRSTRLSQNFAEKAPEVTPIAPRGRRGAKKNNNQTTAAANRPTVGSSDLPAMLDAYHALMSSNGRRGRRSQQNLRQARRNCLAEISAACNNVDYVDLVTSPMHPIQGVITVDSDVEEAPSESEVSITTKTNKLDILENSFDEENPEISVKIKWNGGNAEIFKLRKHQKFLHIFQQLAERENTNIESLVFNIDNRIISASDSPDSINYKIYEFISGRVLTTIASTDIIRKKRNADVISLKVQSELWPKRPLKVELRKTDKLKILYIKCAEELNMPSDALLLSFDGEHLDPNATLIELEFEGGEVVDLRVKKK